MSTSIPAERRLLSGWGRTPASSADVVTPLDPVETAEALGSAGPRGVLARGLGRSYGDVAQNAGGLVVDMTRMAGIESFDHDGAITARAGTSLDTILRAIVPRGRFLAVSPGTRFVTLGGAIANDVHGKNHHADGSFGDHVRSFDLLLASGEVRTLAGGDEAFRATLGGIGLTGIILRATIETLPVETSRVLVDTERCADLDDCMSRMEANDDRYRYSVAWIDALARGAALGRAVLTRGDHAPLAALAMGEAARPLAYAPRALASVPGFAPGVMTPLTARVFNEVWFRKAPKERRDQLVPVGAFFHPLDAVGEWNRLYGRRGFVQHQLVVPFGQEEVVRRAIERLSGARCASFLAVLKRFGPGHGLLSFPMPGWTLALDLPASQPGLAEILEGIDREVMEAGGRIYLAKDARVDPALVPAMYPELDRWREIRATLDPREVLRSDLERRLGLVARTTRKVGTV